jgi:hypothetical protein
MYADAVLEIDKSHRAGCYLLTVKSGRKAQRINRALGGYYQDTIKPDDEAIFHLKPTAMLVALLAAGKAKVWSRAFVANLA